MDASIEELTDREKEVLRLLLAGHTAKSAAAELDLSVHTVNDYLREARKKFGVTSSREAARLLGEYETPPPEKLAPDEIGMAPDPTDVDKPLPSTTPGKRSIAIWAIGGSIMLAAIATIVLLATSSGPTEEAGSELDTAIAADAPAENAAREWLALVDEGLYEQSWSQAGSVFRSAVTAQKWAEQVAPVREPLGSLVSRDVQSIQQTEQLPGMPTGTYRVIEFNTDFSASSDRVETVVMDEENGSITVIGYFVR